MKNIFTSGRPEALGRRGVDAVLPDARVAEELAQIAGVEVDPAGRVRKLVVVDVDGHAAGQVVGTVVEAAGRGERLGDQLTVQRVGVVENCPRPLRFTRH